MDKDGFKTCLYLYFGVFVVGDWLEVYIKRIKTEVLIIKTDVDPNPKI